MSAVNPELPEILEASNRTLMARIHTSIPAEVVAYDPATNTIDAKIAVKDFVFDGDGERKYDDAIVFPSVLVMWPRAGGMVVRLPLVPGDTVNLLFAERSLAEWRTTGQTSEPLDSARLSNGYPVAMPGLSPDVSPLSPLDIVEVEAGAMIVGEDGGAAQMIIGGTVPGVRFGKLAVSPVALSAKVDALFAALAGAVIVAGDGGASLKAALVTALVASPTTASALVKSV